MMVILKGAALRRIDISLMETGWHPKTAPTTSLCTRNYILVKKSFRSGVNIHRTRSFPRADIGSDHDLVMMTFQVRLKMARKPNQPRLRFDLEKLRNPDVACTFQATIGGKLAPLIGLSDEDMELDTMITTYNTAVTDAAREILGKERRKKPWVTKDVLDLCDER